MAIRLPRLRREVPIVENNVPTSTFQQWLDIAFKQIESSVAKLELALAAAGVAIDSANRVLPPGGTADQVLTKVDGTDYNVKWVNASAGRAVDWVDVTGKPSTFTPSSHTHVIADVTGLQTALNGLADRWTHIKLASNSTVSATAFANVTGMSFTAAPNTTYIVTVVGAYQTAATTTGIGLALDIPSGSVVGQVVANTSATAATALEQIADATTTGVTTGVRAANTNTPISAQFVVDVGATGGTVQLLQRSEVAASNTVLQANLTVMGYRAV